MNNPRARIVVLGANVAGLTAALQLRAQLGIAYDVLVLADTDEFSFSPWLLHVAFGLRDRDAMSFMLRPVLDARGIRFRHAPVQRIDLAGQRIVSASGVDPYDVLVIATGARPDFSSVAGLGPPNSHSLLRWEHAVAARDALEHLFSHPGPVVIGAVSPSTASLADLYLRRFVRVLAARGVLAECPITYLRPAGMPQTESSSSPWRTVHADIARVHPTSVLTSRGESLPSVFSLLLPGLVGIDPLRRCGDLVDAAGFVRTDAQGRSPVHANVFAAGTASVRGGPGQPWERTGQRAQADARHVAANVQALLEGRELLAFDEATPNTVRDVDWVADTFRDYFRGPTQRAAIEANVWPTATPSPAAELAVRCDREPRR